MEKTAIPPEYLEAERRKNRSIAVGIGVAGFLGGFLVYLAIIILVAMFPYQALSLLPIPENTEDAVAFGDSILLFSEHIDYSEASRDRDPEKKSVMRAFDGKELSGPEEVSSFYSVTSSDETVYGFSEGGYSTFDGNTWEEVEVPEIGPRPMGVVDGGDIWVLDICDSGLTGITRIHDGLVDEVALPVNEEGEPPSR